MSAYTFIHIYIYTHIYIHISTYTCFWTSCTTMSGLVWEGSIHAPIYIYICICIHTRLQFKLQGQGLAMYALVIVLYQPGKLWVSGFRV